MKSLIDMAISPSTKRWNPWSMRLSHNFRWNEFWEKNESEKTEKERTNNLRAVFPFEEETFLLFFW